MRKRTVGKGAEYYDYIKSPEWKAVKIRYLKSNLAKECYVCRAAWDNSFNFHHRTYKFLGNERLMDIVPVCRPCHEKIHARQNAMGWGLWKATTKVRRAAGRKERIARRKARKKAMREGSKRTR